MTPPRSHPNGAHPSIRTAVIADQPLSLDRAVAGVSDPTVGGIAIFAGVVRNHDADRSVTSLRYLAHPSAAEELTACAEAVAKPYDISHVWIAHRTGELAIGDLAVIVAVGAAHRGPALECCRELIDRLKTEVPIWKEQHFSDGDIDWVGV